MSIFGEIAAEILHGAHFGSPWSIGTEHLQGLFIIRSALSPYREFALNNWIMRSTMKRSHCTKSSLRQFIRKNERNNNAHSITALFNKVIYLFLWQHKFWDAETFPRFNIYSIRIIKKEINNVFLFIISLNEKIFSLLCYIYCMLSRTFLLGWKIK